MNRGQTSRISHADHPIAAPLDDDSVRQVLERGISHGEARVLDLGCGRGEWLLRALATSPRLRAEGVDISAGVLAEADAAASSLGVRERLVLHHQQADSFVSPHTFDLVLSVGAAYAFGGLLPTLAAARTHLAPGGCVLIGDGFWDSEPTPEAVEMLGNFTDLAITLDRVTADGWTAVHGHVSTRQELDNYEWACWGSLAAWALDHAADPDSAEILALATTRRSQWLHSYRECWGFVCLVLRQTPS
jgi:SAM-dependent methyltransferase